MEYFVSSRWNIGFTVVELQAFRQFLRSLQYLRNIFGNVIATFLVNICKLKFLATNRCYCCLATTQINHCCSEFTFTFVQDCFDHSKWGNDDIFNLQACTFNGFTQIVQDCTRSCIKKATHFKSDPHHSAWIANSLETINCEFLRNEGDYFTIRCHTFCECRFDNIFNICICDFFRITCDWNHSLSCFDL